MKMYTKNFALFLSIMLTHRASASSDDTPSASCEGIVLHDNVGTITSPGYPEENYYSGWECHWTFKPTSGITGTDFFLVMNFTDIDIAYNVSVMVNDGVKEVPQFSARLTVSTRNLPMYNCQEGPAPGCVTYHGGECDSEIMKNKFPTCKHDSDMIINADLILNVFANYNRTKYKQRGFKLNYQMISCTEAANATDNGQPITTPAMPMNTTTPPPTTTTTTAPLTTTTPPPTTTTTTVPPTTTTHRYKPTTNRRTTGFTSSQSSPPIDQTSSTVKDGITAGLSITTSDSSRSANAAGNKQDYEKAGGKVCSCCNDLIAILFVAVIIGLVVTIVVVVIAIRRCRKYSKKEKLEDDEHGKDRQHEELRGVSVARSSL